jgi:hypothetical protein
MPGSRGLFPEETGNQGNYDTDNDHGGDWDINFQIWPVYNNITRQPPYGKLPEPWPEKPRSQKYHSQYDQCFLHLDFFPGRQTSGLAPGQLLQQPFHHITVRKFAKMLHNRPHGLHGAFILRKINIFFHPG